jgi:uncharacterized protein (TIGR02300 family)
MPKEDWGVKRLCPTTGKRFYDLNKSPIISPYTGEIVVLEVPGRRGSAAAAAAAEAERARVKKAALVQEDDELLVDDEAEETEANDDLLEDDDEDTVGFDELADVAAEDDDT